MEGRPGRRRRLARRVVRTSVALLGCFLIGCSVIASLGDYVAGASSDASAPDAGGPDASCDGARWCDCNTPLGGICLDFDEDANPLGSLTTTHVVTGDAGTIEPDPDSSVSPPSSLFVAYPTAASLPDGSAGQLLFLEDSVLGPSRLGGPIALHATLEMRPEPAGFGDVQLLYLGIVSSNELVVYWAILEVDPAGAVFVDEYGDLPDGGSLPTNQQRVAVPPVTPGAWHQLAFDVTLTSDRHGVAVVSVDGKSSGAVQITPTLLAGIPDVRVGAVYTDGTSGTALRVDNFTAVAE